MPKGYPTLTNENKKEILRKVQNEGAKAADLAKEYGVNPRNIYNFLRNKVCSPNANLELAKLKRENDSLLRIIGQLVAQQEIGKKNQYGRSNQQGRI